MHQKPFLNKKVVDTIGAGDSFNSGFLHKYLKDEPLSECLKFGALTGAVSTTRSGGTKAFENTETIKAIAKSEFNYIIT
jgi:sugar/nucleoside kinase (ribokinase family)